MKKVCVIGAGPAGLAGAKALLQTKRFNVTVYEKGHRIGGIWAVDENSRDGFLSPFTPTNISHYTVGFSDLNWNAVDLQTARVDGASGNHVPMFPFAWQVNRYLEEFRRRYIPKDTIHLGIEVVKAERVMKNGDAIWIITTRDSTSQERLQEFDCLIVATGFFSAPRPLNSVLTSGIVKNSGVDSVKIIHTSQFRSLQDLTPDIQSLRDRKILILGGGNSSGETAASIAMQLSDRKFTPLPIQQVRDLGIKLVHVTPRPLYAVPPLNPADEECTTFLPLDLGFYNLSKRPAGPIVSNAGQISRGVKDLLHSALQTLVGGNQSDLGSTALTIPSGEPRGPVYVTLSESYAEFVRSASIEVVPGRVKAINSSAENGTAIATVDGDGNETTISDISAVVYATGYTASTAVDFLDDEVKKTLHYDPTSTRLPLILSGYQTFSPQVPDLAFLGFYESPYWTMVEMQADLTVTRWLGGERIPTPAFEEEDNLLALREAIAQATLDVPQYWFGDHLGYMEEAATHLKRTRFHGAFAPEEGPVPSARYRSSYTNTEQADAIMSDVYATWQACTKEGRYVARAAFRALQGNWVIRRVIASVLPSFPSGTLEGTASFHPRRPTKDRSGMHFDFEYLYIESGILVLSNGASVPATRRYVYRYSEARDELSVWFIKPDNDLEVDYLFHNLQFVPPDEARKTGACVAKADHLCVEDMYWTEYRLPIKGIALLEFEAKHTVKGPNKDYVTTTSYRRPEKEKIDSSR